MTMKKNVSVTLSFQLIGFALISLVVLLVYYPSLLHSARADQVMYLAEVAHKQTWWDLAVQSFDLNRHRQFAPGDQLLFRPVMYFVLGTERFFFGNNFFLWQAVGIVLHITVVWFLLRLLLTIRVGISAVVATAVFSLLYINMEMVIWHHINGYMIFMVCLLVALRRWWLIYTRQPQDKKNLFVMGLSIFVGVFTYEPMAVFAFVMAAFLWACRPDLRRWCWLLVVPVLMYAFASWLDAVSSKVVFWEAGRIIDKSRDVIGSLNDMGWTLWFWFFTSLFSIQVPIRFFARNVVDPQAQQELFLLNLSHIGIIAALVLLVLAGVYTVRSLRKHSAKVMPFVLMIIICVVLYCAIIVFGRSNSRGMWDVLRVDLYYNYLFCLLMTLIVFAAIDWQSITSKLCRAVGLIALAIYMYFQGFFLHEVNQLQAQSNGAILVLVQTIEELIKEKGHEKDFSFFVAEHYPGNYMYKELENKNFPNKQYSFIEALYPQYFKSQSEAKYKFLTVNE